MEKILKKTLLDELKRRFEGCADFIVVDKAVQTTTIHLLYIDNLVNKMQASTCIFEPLNKVERLSTIDELVQKITLAGVTQKQNMKEIVNDLLSGCIIIILDEPESVLSCPCAGFEKRAVTEPPTSAVLKGPREGFVEDINTNISMIRRKLKTPDLKVEELKVGKYTQSKVCLVYINSIAESEVVDKIRTRLKGIEIDGIVDSFYLQANLEQKHSNLFKQVGNTEKPEVATAKLLEGRVVIFSDGSPLALTLPFALIEDFQSSDDYFGHPMKASFVRLLRLWGYILSITLPGMYVALQSFHFALLPIDFLISIQSSIQNLSFPPLIEILIVLFLFEILNEASIRMPKYLGMALSIVGALVLGDAAVQAGVISPPSVIMVAVSGITLYMVPDQTATASILRLFFTIIGGVAGFYGMLIGFIALTSYLMTFDSFGTPYFAPFAPFIKSDKKDGFIKVRQDEMLTRPKTIPNNNPVRQKNKYNAKGKGKYEKTIDD